MLQLIKAAAVVVLYLFFYYMTGSLVLHFFPAPEEDSRLSKRLVLGFFTYHFLFTAAALPMKMLLLPLSWLSAVWAGCLAVLFVLFLVFERKAFAARFCRVLREGASAAGGCRAFLTRKKPEPGRSLRTAASFPVLAAVILAQLILFNLNDETFALWDQSYYIGDTATSLYTNTISQYDPYTGYPLDNLNREYLLETYQNHSAVMCQLLHIHPMIEVRTVMTSVVVFLYQMIFYEIGMLLFRRDRLKSAFMLGFLFFLNLFSFNLYTAGEFLMFRPFEGKTILAVLIIPGLFWLFLNTAQEPENRSYWCYSFLVILGSFGLNMSSIFMIPFEISALYIPLAVKKKKIMVYLKFLILLLPCAAFIALYLLTRHYVVFYIGK